MTHPRIHDRHGRRVGAEGRLPPQPLPRRTLLRGAGALAGLAVLPLAACVSLGGSEAQLQLHHRLRDPGAPAQAPRARPLVEALMLQPLPTGALTDTLSMAYAREPHAYAFYQHASWTERPLRQVPRLLQQRLQARGVAATVALLGEPVRADWLLMVAVDALHHDASATPGQGRVGLTLELIDRRSRRQVARRSVEAAAPLAQEGAAGAAQAMSTALAQAFDALLPWLEAELERASRG